MTRPHDVAIADLHALKIQPTLAGFTLHPRHGRCSSRLRKRGVQRGEAPLTGVWG
jgi:hypothetical protein